MIGSVAVTQTASSAFAVGVDQPLIFCNVGTKNCYIRKGGTAEAEKGFCLFAGESKAAKDISPQWTKNLSAGYTAICASGETTTLTWST